jgi:signal transduction histidine kinase
VLSIALEIEELNNANIAAQKAEMARRQEAFRRDMRRLLWQTVLLGLAVAIIVVVRLRVLEHRSEDAEGRMRELSQQLVNTQEEERRNLSRELHDHVAQVLTGLRMGLGRIERTSGDRHVSAAVAECRQLVDDMFRTVRDLALGLRPSMLDDFGLQPALEWLVRDFSRRSHMDVELKIEGDVASLPDKHRTCVYRVIQEAMTNCARHARAKTLLVEVASHEGLLRVAVSDDGIGLDPELGRRGLGLRGIEERVKELRGSMNIARRAGAGAGTTLSVLLPVPAATTETALARVAG